MEWQLDTDISFDKYQKWGPQSLQRPFIFHRMFYCADAHGKRECDRAIHQVQRQPSPKQDLKAEVYTMDLIQPRMVWADIRNIYNDVYQLRRSLEESPCDDAMAEKIYQSILEFVKEHLQHRQECAQSLEQQESTSALSSDPPPEFQPRTNAPYKHIKPGSYEEALVVVQDVHCQALIMAHLLEDHIEQLGWQVSCRWSCRLQTVAQLMMLT